MLHIVFEACPEALRAFVGALLHLKAEEIVSIKVTNPVEYGTGAYSKNFVLDLKIILNFRVAPGDTKFYSNYYMMDEEPPQKI